MGNAFLYYGALSSCAPNLDIPGLWDLTNAVGFPPGDDGPDLVATFHEWDVSGTGEITWNDFVREMTTRINDPNHFEAQPLPETIDGISIPDRPLGDAWKHINHNASDDGYERFDAGGGGGEPTPPPPPDMYAAFCDGSWKEVLASVQPETDGAGLPGGLSQSAKCNTRVVLQCSILIRPVVKIVLGATVELINILLVCANFDGSIFPFTVSRLCLW